MHISTHNYDRYTLQLYITASPICFESYHAIIRDTNNTEQAGRQKQQAEAGNQIHKKTGSQGQMADRCRKR
jgi:hypothetical protein